MAVGRRTGRRGIGALMGPCPCIADLINRVCCVTSREMMAYRADEWDLQAAFGFAHSRGGRRAQTDSSRCAVKTITGAYDNACFTAHLIAYLIGSSVTFNEEPMALKPVSSPLSNRPVAYRSLRASQTVGVRPCRTCPKARRAIVRGRLAFGSAPGARSDQKTREDVGTKRSARCRRRPSR